MNGFSSRVVILFAGAWLLVSMGACTSGAQGTYSDQSGGLILELKSGGKANLTMQGEIVECTYSTSGKQITVECKGPAGINVFNVHDDGSLTGPPGSFFPALRKQK